MCQTENYIFMEYIRIYMKTNIKNNSKKISTNLAESDYISINKLIEKGKYLNHSDFFRDAIRYRLENLKKY